MGSMAEGQRLYNAMTGGFTNDQKVDLFNKKIDIPQVEGLRFWLDKDGKKERYYLQEELGEHIESYIERRDEARKRDELRKRMLGSTNVSGADGKNNTMNRENLG